MTTERESPGLERAGLATTLFALAAIATTVSLGSIVGRSLSGRPWAPVVLAIAAMLASLGLGALARSGRGSLARLALRLPARLEGSFSRHRARSILASVLMVVSVLQLARLSCFMADDSLRWGSAFPPVKESVGHMCQAAYTQAADLTRQGVSNIYAEQYYPAYQGQNDGAAPAVPPQVKHLQRYIKDAFEYPPVFLLLPRLGLALSNDYMVHRSAWFMLQLLLFLSVAIAVTRKLDPDSRLVALVLLPAVMGSLPTMYALQFGQWHLAAVTLSVAAMLLFSERRNALGGLSLAAAVTTKLFPGVLLVYLLVRRRWSAVAWTAGFCLILVALGLVVLGVAPFTAFVTYHLPRMASGDAFSFFLDSNLSVASNYGVYAIPFKLERLGVPGMSVTLASGLAWLYTAGVIIVAAIAGRRSTPTSDAPGIWLALLVLASLRSPVAPFVYTVVPALWLLSILAWRVGSRMKRGAIFIVLGWLALGHLPPLPSPPATIAWWMIGQAVLLTLGFWVALRVPVQEQLRHTSPSNA